MFRKIASLVLFFFFSLVTLRPADLPVVPVLLEMLGKFGVTASFCIVYAVSSELFPTVIRNIGMGCCSVAARIGTITSPFLIYLGRFRQEAPYLTSPLVPHRQHVFSFFSACFSPSPIWQGATVHTDGQFGSFWFRHVSYSAWNL